MDFSASPSGIANGGDPIALSWNVPNANRVPLRVQNGRQVHEVTGPAAATGTVDVYPNAATTYELTADNGAGVAVTPATVDVTVQTPATLVYAPTAVPTGASIQITGSTASGITALSGLPAVRNLPGEAFVDIVGNGGTAMNYVGPDTAAVLVTLPETFSFPLFGKTVSGNQLSLSINGWFAFRSTTFTGPDVATPFTSSLLPGNSFGPLMEDLRKGSGDMHWRLDTVNGVRRLIVQWNNVQIDLSNAAVAGSSLTFQAQLYEDGKVVYAYPSLTGLTTQKPSIGMQDATATRAATAPIVPAAGDTLTFFGSAPLPVTVIATPWPFNARGTIGTSELEIDSVTPLIPPGQFSISEANVNPAPGQAQWLEVRNNTATAQNLGGWVLNFGGGMTHTIAGALVLPPNGQVLLGPSAAAAEGATVDYAYGTGLAMPAASGQVSVGISGAAYSTLAWGAQVAQGVSVQVGPADPALSLAAGVTQLVCPGTAPYGASGQLGSPGGPNGRCFPYVKQGSSPHSFQSILATGATPAGFTATSGDESAEIVLGRPVPLFGALRSSLWVSSNGFASFVNPSGSHLTNNAAVATTNPNGVLAPFWDDLEGQSGAGVRWQQFDPDATPGTGDEYTLISWESWKVWGTTSNLNFQIRISEGTGNVDFLYGSMTSADAGGAVARGSLATTWLENGAGTAALVHNVNSATAPGINPSSAVRFVFTP
jgi:hypothetical protein